MSLRELERAVAILEREIIGHRVQAIVQPDDETLALTLYGEIGRASCRERV